MDKTAINPWTWQDEWGFSQAWKVEAGQTMVFISGQTGVDADGEVQHEDDFEAHCRLMFENMGTVLEQAGASFDDVVKITVFIKNMDNLPAFTKVKKEFFSGDGPAQSAVGVTTLAIPALEMEVEAMAVL
jgi:2-iminobutanoate/2-iminopropanoate deaminase